MESLYRTAFIMLPVIIAVYIIPFLLLHYNILRESVPAFARGVFSHGGFEVVRPWLLKGLLYFFGGVAAHELLHALGWLPFTAKGFRSLRFGVKMPEMAPYAHCTEPLPVKGYRIGILLPGIMLGIVPAIFGIAKGNAAWLLYGIFFTWAASGDFIMFWLIKDLKSTTMVKDHPEKVGCFITGNKESDE